MQVYLIAINFTIVIFTLIFAMKFLYKQYKWKKLLKYLSPYYPQFNEYLILKGIKFDTLYPLADIYKLVLDFMHQENLLTKEYNSYLYELIADTERKTEFVECCGGTYRHTYNLAMVNNLFRYNNKNIKISYDN